MPALPVSSTSRLRGWLVGLLPIPAIFLGAMIARGHGVDPDVFDVNVVGLVIGFCILGVLSHYSWKDLLDLSLPIAIVGVFLLASTLLFPGEYGVNRWIVFKLIRLNASAVTMPWLLLAVAGFVIQKRLVLASVVLAATQTLHVLQPDAGQATAFGVSAAALLAATRGPGTKWRVAGCSLALVGTAGAWLREDQLGAVPQVERILHLASDCGAGWLIAALAALGALVVFPAVAALRLRSVRSEAVPLAISLAIYFGLTVAVTELGNFPAPVLGAGAGPLIGWYGLVGVLLLVLQAPSTSTSG